MNAVLLSLLAIVLAWALGSLLVACLWPRRGEWAFVIFLGAGLGLGLTSVIFFCASLLSARPLLLSLPVELLLGAFLLYRARRKQWSLPSSSDFAAKPPHSWLVSLLWLVFAIACAVAVFATVVAWRAEPFGGWDGWALWNMKARFIYRGGTEWPLQMMQQPLSWTHRDYPLLVPASVARAWTMAGTDSPLAAGVVSLMFGLSTVGLLVTSLIRLRNPVTALTGGLLLLSTPFFVRFSSNEHADIPVGCFMLAATVLLALAREKDDDGVIFLAGLAAGFAAWTKNEGLLFCVALGLVFVAGELAGNRWRRLLPLCGGLALALAPVFFFKFTLAPANDIVAGQHAGGLARLADWPRHRIILMTWWRDLPKFGEWHVVPFWAMALVLIGPVRGRWERRAVIVTALLLLMSAGYYTVYLLSPFDLTWHLDSSLVRLFIQLWPMAIFLWCLMLVRTALPASTTPSGMEARRR